MLTPGSFESVQEGCICPMGDNLEFQPHKSVEIVWTVHPDCPIHGDSLWHAITEGKNRLGLWFDPDTNRWMPRYFPSEDESECLTK